MDQKRIYDMQLETRIMKHLCRVWYLGSQECQESQGHRKFHLMLFLIVKDTIAKASIESISVTLSLQQGQTNILIHKSKGTLKMNNKMKIIKQIKATARNLKMLIRWCCHKKFIKKTIIVKRMMKNLIKIIQVPNRPYPQTIPHKLCLLNIEEELALIITDKILWSIK